MSHGEELLPIGPGATGEVSFDNALRGYDRRQVNRFVAHVDTELSALSAERDAAIAQAQALAGQVQAIENELADLRRRTAHNAAVSFRHLGPRVEQILSLAEEQADAIRAGATHDIEGRRIEAERILDDARERANQAVRDFELALAARRGEEDAAAAARRAELQEELRAGREEITRLRAESDATIAAAKAE